jgi:glyoxylase-like metal-dependent hydrolase (beta-lactamase superfamily II)
MRLDHIVTSGVFSLDGQSFEVDNNVWLLGDDEEVLVVDAPHDADAIAAAVGGRSVVAIACSHAHNDHIDAALALRERVDAPVLLHPADRVLWVTTHSDAEPDGDLADGDVLTVAGADVRVVHTPGHAPGAVCLHVAEEAWLFSGDTLFKGGPGATGRSFSDFPTILASIRERLLTLPDETVVYPGHGETTTIGAERHDYDLWLTRGH